MAADIDVDYEATGGDLVLDDEIDRGRQQATIPTIGEVWSWQSGHLEPNGAG